MFGRDAGMAEAWLCSQEPLVRSAELGCTVDEVESLIKRHEAFQKSAVAWEERFNALEKLTAVRATGRPQGCPAPAPARCPSLVLSPAAHRQFLSSSISQMVARRATLSPQLWESSVPLGDTKRHHLSHCF